MRLSKEQQLQILYQLPIPGKVEYSQGKFWCDCSNPECLAVGKAGIYYAHGTYRCHCFRCNKSYTFSNFLWLFYKDYYVKEKVQQYGSKFEKKIEVEVPEFKIENADIKLFIEDLFRNKHIIPLLESDNDQAIHYLEKRKIPENKMKDFFYTDNFYRIHDEIKKLKNEAVDVKNYHKDERILWFFKSRTNNVLGIQGRAIGNSGTRYLISKFNGVDLVGNLENIDINQPVYATEGYLDSLFLPNAISIQGLNINILNYLLDEIKIKNLTFIFDNQPENKAIKKIINVLAEKTMTDKRLSLCLLPSELRKYGKDINEYVLNGVTPEKLINSIRDNSYQGLMLKARSLQWELKI